MAKADESMGSWDKVEATESFQEQIGRQQDDSQVSGDMAGRSAEDPAMISMPEESMAAEEIGSFREQLPMNDGEQQTTTDEFTAAAQEQLKDDEPE